VHEDSTTKPGDIQPIYDNLSAKDKKLFWIEGTTRRFDGYNYFGEKPELMLEWFDSHMGGLDALTGLEQVKVCSPASLVSTARVPIVGGAALAMFNI
jgi:hypothetical protein